MSRDLHAAAAITPPVSGSDDMVRLAGSATPAVFVIPDTWLDSWVTITMEGESGHVAFTKDSSLVVDPTDVTTLSSGAISAHGTAECKYIPADASEPFDLSKLPRLNGGESWYLAHVETAGGYIEIRRTSGPASNTTL